VGIFLLRFFRYWINPDATSYISIAMKYLRGDVWQAVNGLWGPLLSWLLMPFMALGASPALGAKALSLCIGVFAITSIYCLSRRFEISDSQRLLLLLFLLPMFLFFTLFDFTPDLLLASFLAFYLYALLDRDYPRSERQGVTCGIFATLAYLSKAYAMPFFIVHFALCNALVYIKGGHQTRRLVLRSCLLGYAVFLAISGIWVGCMSAKYGRLTFGSAGKYNYERMGFAEKGLPEISKRFLVPPNETATHAWEDPVYIHLRSWSPLQSMQAFKYQIDMVRKTAVLSIAAYNWFSIFSIAILALVLVNLCTKAGESIVAQRTDLFSMLTIGIYNCGFLPLGILQERYMLISAFLLVLLGTQLIAVGQRGKHLSEKRKISILMLFLVSFSVMPAQALKRHANDGKSAYLMSVRLTGEYHIKGNIASNANYSDMLQVAFWTGNRYFGVLDDTIPGPQLLDTLRTHNIAYYFVWSASNTRLNLPRYVESTLSGVPDLRIYALQAPDPRARTIPDSQ
jgi:4-amino-4-deoxy-L-arabinose transferase-like glycosyltransferase